MTIGVNCGHTKSGAGYGAVGIIKESEHTRLVGQALMDLLRSAGITVIDCTIDSANTQNEYLSAVVALANRQDLDWFISIHFNASASHEGHGVEVYTYEGRQYQDAVRVCNSLSDLGFVNRGVKVGTGLYVIRKTKAKSMLIEVCFCDSQLDVELYSKIGGAETIAKAIYNALYDCIYEEGGVTMSHEQFIEFIGEIAVKDWRERKIVLPSIVIAQAIKESGWGTSELAKNANALFGIKQNGWKGKVYYKDATEQNPDGTYRKDESTAWRAYDNWEQSVLDHNTYIAERKVGNQAEPNFKETVGEENLKKAIAGLVGNEMRKKSADNCTDVELKQYVLFGKTQFSYATSQTYTQSILSDYIEKYGLTKFDVETEMDEKEETAPEGMLYIVQAGAYKIKKNAEEFQKRLDSIGVKTIVQLYNV